MPSSQNEHILAVMLAELVFACSGKWHRSVLSAKSMNVKNSPAFGCLKFKTTHINAIYILNAIIMRNVMILHH